MKHRPFCVALPLVLASGLMLSAQDAGMVLRTSVTYNTQKATLPLTDDQRRRADEPGVKPSRLTEPASTATRCDLYIRVWR